MKILYIESRFKGKQPELMEEEIAKLPKKLFLAYSIQYKEYANAIKKQLEKSSIKVSRFQQVLGCSSVKTEDPILLIGTGRFHAINLYSQSKELYILENGSIKKIPHTDLEAIRLRKKTALIKFLSAEKVGILVSTKPGQENLSLALDIKKKLKKKGKSAMILLSNHIDTSQFENFGISSFVNTACPGIYLDAPEVINYAELKEEKLI